jgi:hypothetical protein
MAEREPSLRDRQPWKAVVENDYAWLGGVITKHYQGDDSDLHQVAAGLLAAYAGATIEVRELRCAAEDRVLAAVQPVSSPDDASGRARRVR